MREMAIYGLDSSARLRTDEQDFEVREAELPPVEREAFLLFKQMLEEKLADEAFADSKSAVSQVHRQFIHEVTALESVIASFEHQLFPGAFGSQEPEKPPAVLASALTIALHYRYPFGVSDHQLTLDAYLSKKRTEYQGVPSEAELEDMVLAYVTPHSESATPFQLVTLRKEAGGLYTAPGDRQSLAAYLDEAIEQVSEAGGIRKSALRRLDFMLSLAFINFPHRWANAKEGTFTFWETKVIVEDLLYKLRGKLREAHLMKDEEQIKEIVFAVNLLSNYLMGQYGREMLQPAEITVENQLQTHYLNAGLLGASMYTTALAYAEDVRILGARGHGVAAERANHILDKLAGKEAELMGDDNSKNGADRLSDQQLIQTKYCSSGGKCISECFEDGRFRYMADGKPMTIEVPKDQYESAVKSMEDRIRRGDMQDVGITDPEAAKEIVKKGAISYKTAQRIAKAGTVEGVVYDASSGMIVASEAFGLSFTISFAQSIWRGESVEAAGKEAAETGVKVFGRSLMQHVVSKQLGRTAVEKSLRPLTDHFTKQVLGSKTSAKLVNTFVRQTGKKAIHGAAATNQLSKVMRGNMVTMAVTTAIMSSGDIHDAIRGRISGKQLAKNVGTAGAGVGGAAAGAAIGSVVPVVGTLVGGLVGGWLGTKASKKALDKVVEDDSVAVFDKLKTVFSESVEEMELNREEFDFILNYLFDQKKMPKLLKMIYAADSQRTYIEELMDPYLDAILKSRPKVNEVYLLEQDAA